MTPDVRVGLLWRREWDPPGPAGPDPAGCRLHGVFAAFADLGVRAEGVVYADDAVDSVREHVLQLDALLVWVNPIEHGLDRSRLDSVLREAADNGVFVSAHPDVIGRMATKRVLVDTQSLGWGTPTLLHRSVGDLRARLAAIDAATVLKRHWGMGGDGVWKVEPLGDGTLTVQHALAGAAPERLPLESFVELCTPYFDGDGFMVEQPYQPRLPEGMIRAYLTHDRVVGFTHQHPRGLLPPAATPGPPGKVFALPDDPRYARLRQRLETEWVPQLQDLVGVARAELPVIWDADFLFGPGDADGSDTFVLCEINASSTFAFPEFAMAGVARVTLERLGSTGCNV